MGARSPPGRRGCRRVQLVQIARMEPGQLDPVNGLRSPQGNHQLLDPIKNAIVIGKPAYMGSVQAGGEMTL